MAFLATEESSPSSTATNATTTSSNFFVARSVSSADTQFYHNVIGECAYLDIDLVIELLILVDNIFTPK